MDLMTQEDGKIKGEIYEIIGHPRASIALSHREMHKLWNLAKRGHVLIGSERAFIAAAQAKVEGRAA